MNIFGRISVALVALLLLLAGSVAIGWWLLAPAVPGADSREIEIPSGNGTRAVGELLQRERIIRSSFGFVVYAWLAGVSHELKSGRYLLCPCDSAPTIVDTIASGRAISDDISITIPEGLNIWEIDRVLSGTMPGFRRGQFSSEYRDRDGRLFPDTYRFAKDATAGDIIHRMEDEFFARAGSITKERLAIASIIEKEVKSADDMALVSGIIAKRLEIGMPIQVDATVAYGWCVRTVRPGGLCDVTQAPLATEVSVDGPYNTYTRTGLPDGPISNPGLQALEYAANPKASGYLYYLSTRDGLRIIYARTLAEHLVNRRKHLGF